MIETPLGIGRFLEYDSNTGKVIVEMESMFAVEFDGNQCFVRWEE